MDFDQEQALREQNTYLAALHEITLGLIQNLDLNQLLETILARATDLGRTGHGFLDIVDQARGEMRLEVARGHFSEQLGVWTKPGDGLSGRVLATGQTLMEADYSQFGGQLPGYEWLRTIVAVPMMSGSRVIGVIGLGYDEVVSVTPGQIERLNQFARLVSLALHNAQLYAAAQQELDRRKQAEDALIRHRQKLEEMVEQRTAELSQANNTLEAEVIERRRAASLLRESEARYRLLVQNVPMGIALADQDGTILSINPAAVTMVGAPSIDAALKINLLTHPLLVEAGISADLRCCLETETTIVNEKPYLSSFGKVAYFRYYASPVRDADGVVNSFLILFEDIAPHKLAEEAQQAAYQRLRELNQMKDNFITHISHELRTPITSIKLYTHLMSRKPEQAASYTDKLAREGARLEAIVEGILRLSEIRDSLNHLRLAKVDLTRLVNEVLHDFLPRLGGHQLIFSDERADLPMAHGDPDLLAAVVEALLDNAVKYTPAGGSIRIQMYEKMREGGAWIGLELGNTGPAIPADERPYLFDLFYRGKASLDTGTPGAGLGLAISKEIIDHHGGEIEVAQGAGVSQCICDLAACGGVDSFLRSIVQDICTGAAMMTVSLREVTDADLPIFFEHQQDKEAVYMAAFTHEDPSDRAAFDAHWAKIRARDSVINRTIEVDGQVAGHIASFEMFGDREITYWIGREFWGQGVATAALTLLLSIDPTRPIHGRAAKDNIGSIRVLEKCGFVLVGEETGFANARGKKIAEVILKLE